MPLAMSSATPSLPIGCIVVETLRVASVSLVPSERARIAKVCWPMSVSMTPGWIEFTRMRYPLRPNSSAVDLVNSVTPPLVSE